MGGELEEVIINSNDNSINGGDLEEVVITTNRYSYTEDNSFYFGYIISQLSSDDESNYNPCDSNSNYYDECSCDPSSCDDGTPPEAPPCNITSCPAGYVLDSGNCECVNDPCSPESKQAGETVTNFYQSNLNLKVSGFSPFTLNSNQKEEAFSVESNNGIITTSSIKTLDSNNGGTISITHNTIADVHTHPDGGYATPSAVDLWSLGDAKSFATNFTDSYIIASDETKYALHISDASLLATFMQNNGTFYDSNTHGFLPTSDLGKSFDRFLQSLTTNNPDMSIFEAQDRATAFILKNSGVDLLRAEPGSNIFKKIDVVPDKNPDGTEKKDANGNTIYKNADCY